MSESWGPGNRIMERPVSDEKQMVQWIAAKPLSDQEQATREHFQELLKSASQPRHASNNACVKLCYFIEQCSKSTSAVQTMVAFSHKTCLDLFNFYIEWNEKNQHRSMRQVLELLVSLIMLNPDEEVSSVVKIEILEQVLIVITHQSAQPLVKPSFKVLECLLSKDVISISDLSQTYGSNALFESRVYFRRHSQEGDDSNLMHSFVDSVFEWLALPDTSPATGRLLVTLFQKLRSTSTEKTSSGDETYIILWQQWIRNGLRKYPDSLENIKNYLFPPLFKLDKVGSLKFLQDLGRESHVEDLESEESDAQALLLLSAMEVGKKAGLVNEPLTLLNRGGANLQKSIILPEERIGGLLSHRAGNVRSAAFSVLVSSVSSIQPFSLKAFNFIRQNLQLLHSDTDSKVRNEVVSNTKHMIGRIKGAVSFLSRDATSNLDKRNQKSREEKIHISSTKAVRQEAVALQEHDDFVLWYQNFLVNELIPTASYQRHITSLRAIQIVVGSGILIPNEKTSLDANRQATRPKVFFGENMIRLLLDLLMDPFEDVRAAASQLLKLAPKLSFERQNNLETLTPRSSQASSPFFGNTISDSVNNTFERITTDGGILGLQKTRVPEVLYSFIQKAEKASKRTGRADLADGVARTHELIYCLQTNDEERLDLVRNLVSNLEMRVLAAENDLVQAVLVAPVHGQFAALRLIWEQFGQSHGCLGQPTSTNSINNNTLEKNSDNNSAWINLQHRMIKCCIRIWAAVKLVLCNDSPEGHLPQGLDEIDALDTKDILSYSFRAIHESSNLLRAMVNKLKLKFADDSAILPFEVFHAAGSLSFEQLTGLRHRGAFSTVSLTFARCCQLTLEDSHIRNSGAFLLNEWYQGTLMCIFEQSSTTRRSAGIPSLMTGILSAHSKSPALDDVMSRLKTLARLPIALTTKDETNLPQVHALNCLKEIFKSSNLGRRCEGYIVDCLQIAAESLRSKTWAIRNCGLLLLRSLIDSLFGTNESKSTAEAGWDGKSIRLAYERYPDLPQILLSLIAAKPSALATHTSPQIGDVESVFPALDIIRRAGPPKKLRAEIHGCVKFHLGSSIWHVRDIAARTICTLLLEEKWMEGLVDLLETCDDSSNQIHGVLLATKYFLERRLELNQAIVSEELTVLTQKLKHLCSVKPQLRQNQMNETAFTEIAVIVLKIAHFTGSGPIILQSEGDIFIKATALLQAGQISSEARTLNSSIDGECPSLLKRSMALCAVYTAANCRNIDLLEPVVSAAIKYDDDIACDILEHMSVVLNFRDGKAGDLEKLVDTYIGAYSTTLSNTTRTIALRNLAEVLEHLLQSGRLNRTDEMCYTLRDFGLSLPWRGSPDLLNAEVRMTGSLLALEFLHHRQQDSFDPMAERIQVWGEMLSDIGKPENVFDTRYAAVAALSAFYSACSAKIVPSLQNVFLVPSLLALYDILNDDDDEIRDGGSIIVSRILGSQQAPLVASTKLLQWIHQKFARSEALSNAIINRITTSSSKITSKMESVEQQLESAMQNDDSLFVEEEQNLYIDEVRGTREWIALIATLEPPLSDTKMSQLSLWALGGLLSLARLAETEDGPFGWSSKPQMFALCMKIILVANGIIASYDKNPEMEVVDEKLPESLIKKEPLREAMRCLLEVGRRNRLHPVLLEELAKSDVN